MRTRTVFDERLTLTGLLEIFEAALFTVLLLLSGLAADSLGVYLLLLNDADELSEPPLFLPVDEDEEPLLLLRLLFTDDERLFEPDDDRLTDPDDRLVDLCRCTLPLLLFEELPDRTVLRLVERLEELLLTREFVVPRLRTVDDRSLRTRELDVPRSTRLD